MKLSRPLTLLSDDIHAMHGICARIAERRAEERAVLPAPEEWRPVKGWLARVRDDFRLGLLGERSGDLPN